MVENDYTKPRGEGILEGKTILVTGAGNGIGKAVSIEYARQGATVILLGKTKRNLEGVYDEITDYGYPEPAILVVDLAEPTGDAFKTIGAAISGEFNQLDGIVHNAAELGMLTPLEIYVGDQWDHVFQVNVKSPLLVTQQCLPLLKEATYASIIFTTDESGIKPKGYWGAYGVSKAAILHMARMWAIEYANTSIRVNIVDPGPCRTGLRLLTHPGMPMKRYTPPEAITSIYTKLMDCDVLGHNGELFYAHDFINPDLDDRTERDLATSTK
ncbi:SDR family NAD(P)-dependent oxidoreductase [Acidithiobacillus sp.]|jgi:NAD(P)-dependent dehydrogenase (short-subunit alcohol dehydrogenase family)|uniref:SDR family NAD(P)-dependent oxidoreductase n=1 Tax=Acidithiobacillus sp. TaxID=1872118 RepID=UPI0025B89D2F|nr:SDR family NAD(P)-dependent oxidoreductase [Acidithiobacillus sp.]MCK9188023.1 SDR family NAD(P)-dependent oxidoreductase [Acidithiobacillus sp.]MCK9359983.1 SDR family NAD(P)-dependent oxidoreductase [Acidithiobacillus sp.]